MHIYLYIVQYMYTHAQGWSGTWEPQVLSFSLGGSGHRGVGVFSMCLKLLHLWLRHWRSCIIWLPCWRSCLILVVCWNIFSAVYFHKNLGSTSTVDASDKRRVFTWQRCIPLERAKQHYCRNKNAIHFQSPDSLRNCFRFEPQYFFCKVL